MVNYLEMRDLENCIVAKDDEPNVPVEVKPDRLKKAKNALVLSVDDSIFVHIRKAKTALEIWTTLQNLYEDNGLLRKIGLLRTLISVRLENVSSMQSYVDEIMNTSNKLSGIGFDIDDEWIAAILLAGLTDEYKPLIMSIEGSGIELTSDSIKRKLLDNQFDDNLSTPATGYLSRRMARREKICFSCGGKNHISVDCKFRKDDDSDTESLSVNRKNRVGKANSARVISIKTASSRDATNNPLGEGAPATCFMAGCVKNGKGKVGPDRNSCHSLNILQSRHVWIKGKQWVVPFKNKNSRLLDDGGRNMEKFVSVREPKLSSKMKGSLNGQKIRSCMASNEVEDIIKRLFFKSRIHWLHIEFN